MHQKEVSQELIDHLFFLHKAMHRGMESDSLKSGITVPQRSVLGMLVRYGSLSVKELSQKVELSHSTISGIVDRLENKGLVKRFQDPQDRRFTKVTISAEVYDYVQNKMRHYMFSGIVDAFKNATAEEQAKILDGLTILRQLLDKEFTFNANRR